ncbi:unnamed protein product [Chrysoparadoxa australica]
MSILPLPDLGRVLSSGGEEGGDPVSDQGVGALVLALCIGVICRAYLKQYIPLPYTVLVLVTGIIIGIIQVVVDTGFGQDLGGSLQKVLNMDPEIIFYALLPILIFESAFFTDVHIFMRELWQVLFLAGPGVLVSCVLTACFAKYIFPYSWSWDTALYFGAMATATDPVAVVALLKELGVSERLAVLIEGESLLNDGTAIVVFSVFFRSATGEQESTPSTVILSFLRLALGGPAVGLAVGAAGAFLIGYMLEDPISELSSTVVVCYSAFLLAEATVLRVSGVLALVFGGLHMSFYGRPRISTTVQQPLRDFWHLAAYMANTIIFFISGLVVASESFGPQNNINPADWGYLIALYLYVHLVRALMVALSWPVLKRGYGINAKQGAVLVYSGLRGAVGLTLALIVQQSVLIDPDTGDKVMFMMAGLALLTLLINGTTIGNLLHWLGLDKVSDAQTEIFIRACSALEAKLEHVVEGLKKDRFLGDSDWPILWRYIPIMTSRVYWHRIRVGNIVLANGEETAGTSKAGATATQQADGAGLSGLNDLTDSGGLTSTQAFDGNKTFKIRLMEAADIGGIGKFSHLPARLRGVWAKTHQTFYTDAAAHQGWDEAERVMQQNQSLEQGHENYRSLEETVHLPKRGLLKPSRMTSAAVVSRDRGWTLDKQSHGTKLFPRMCQDIVPTPDAVAQDEALDSAAQEPTLVPNPLSMPNMAERALTTPVPSTSVHDLRRSSWQQQQQQQQSTPVPSTSAHDLRRTALQHHATRRSSEVPISPDRSPERSMRMFSDSSHARLGEDRSGSPPGTAVEDEASFQALRDDVEMARDRLADVDALLERQVQKADQLTHGLDDSRGLNRALLLSKLTVDHHGVTQVLKEGLRKGGVEGVLQAEEGEALAEARVRFVMAVKAAYAGNFRKGWLSDSGLRVLQDNADVQLDDGTAPLQEWSRLRESFSIPEHQLTLASTLRRLPVIGPLVGKWIFKKLAFVFELASNFIAAHEEIDILELLPEGPAADHLAHENLVQLNDASGTLGQQLPAFPEVARSLKTQVSSRFVLTKHRQFTVELAKRGFINEKEQEELLHQNTICRIMLDDHPYAEHLPPRSVILCKIPFLRQLPDMLMKVLVEDDTICQEEFHGSNVLLMEQGSTKLDNGANRGKKGWYYIVRGSVLMMADSKDLATSTSGSMSSTAGKKGPKFTTLHAGAVFGMTDQMLGVPFRAAYTTASFVHLFFFDRDQLLQSASKHEELGRALWRTVGASVLRRFFGFHRMSPRDLHKLIFSSELVDLSLEGVGIVTSAAELKVAEIRARATTARHNQGSSLETTSSTLMDDGAIHIRKIAREPSIKTGFEEVEGGQNKVGIKVLEVDPNYYILLVKGTLLAHPALPTQPAVEEHKGPCLLTDVHGRLVFTDDTKMFLITGAMVQRYRAEMVINEKVRERATISVKPEEPQGDRRPSARSDLAVRQKLTQKHRTMAKRATDRASALGATLTGDAMNPLLDSIKEVSPVHQGTSYTGVRRRGRVKMIELDAEGNAAEGEEREERMFSGVTGVVSRLHRTLSIGNKEDAEDNANGSI